MSKLSSLILYFFLSVIQFGTFILSQLNSITILSKQIVKRQTVCFTFNTTIKFTINYKF